MKISIYTSAYNAEKYVAKCIESVLNQTFTDFEYWLVDNGSTDNTRKILQHYSALDRRIKLICLDENDTWFRANMIQKMNGEYYTVLDADDWIDPEYMAKLVKAGDETNADIICCGTTIHVEENNCSSNIALSERIIVDKSNIVEYFPYIHWFFRHIWGMIVKTEVAKNTEVPDTDEIGIYYGGDTLCSFELIKNSSKICVDDSILYNYRQHKESVSYKYDCRQSKSDIYLYEYTVDFLKSYKACTNRNIAFLKLVYSNALNDTLKNIKKAKINIDDKMSEVVNILERKITRSLFFIPNDPGIRNEFDEKHLESIYNNNAFLVSCFLEYYYGADNRDQKAYDVLKACLPQCHYVLTDNNIPFFLADHELLYALSRDNETELVTIIARYIRDNQYIKQYDLIQMIQHLEKNNALILKITEKRFIRKYYEIYNLTVRSEYSLAMERLDVLFDDNKRDNISENIIWLYITLSAILEDAEKFIYGKLYAARFYLKAKRYDECEMAILDLEEMGVENNEEIEEIKKIVKKNRK